MTTENSRRYFLKKTGTALVVSSMFPTIWVKKSLAKTQAVTIGHHSHQYRVVEGWGVLDAGKNPVNDCHEMVEDAKAKMK